MRGMMGRKVSIYPKPSRRAAPLFSPIKPTTSIERSLKVNSKSTDTRAYAYAHAARGMRKREKELGEKAGATFIVFRPAVFLAVREIVERVCVRVHLYVRGASSANSTRGLYW